MASILNNYDVNCTKCMILNSDFINLNETKCWEGRAVNGHDNSAYLSWGKF